MVDVETAEEVFAPDQRFLMLENGCCICLGVAQEAVALSSCGQKALVYSTTERSVMYSMAYLPTRLELPFKQLLRFRNRFIGLTGQRVVLNERYLQCEFRKNSFDEPLSQVETTAIIRRKRRCPFHRRVEMDVQYRFHPLNITERGEIGKIACTTISHSINAGCSLAQFEVLDTITLPPHDEERDMSRICEELEACKDFLVTYSRTRQPMYPYHTSTLIEVSNGTVFVAVNNEQVEVWMRAKPGEEWGDVLLLERGFVTCLTVDRDVVALQSSDETIQEKFGRRECALDTLLLGHGFGISASAATAALAKKMAAFQESLSFPRHSQKVAQCQAVSRATYGSTGNQSCFREYSNSLGIYRAMGSDCILVRFHDRVVVRYDVGRGVFKIVSSDGDELSSTVEHPFPLTREQASSIEWFASWGFKSDEEVEELHQKVQAMSAMVHTAVQRSSLFLAFLDKKHDGHYLPSPISVACGSSPQYTPNLSAQQQASYIPTGKDLTDLASRMLERNRNYLNSSHTVISDAEQSR